MCGGGGGGGGGCYGKANKPSIACKLLTQSLVQLLSVVCVNKLLLQ